MTIKRALFYTFMVGAILVFCTWLIGHLWVFIILVFTALIGIAYSCKKEGSDKEHEEDI